MHILGVFASSWKSDYLLTGSYDSIATTSVGAAGTSSITFSSIPSTYTHLQLRFIARTKDYAATAGQAYIYFNNTRSGQYSMHSIYGNGTSATVEANASTSEFYVYGHAAASAASGIFGMCIIDIFDYTNNNKFKTTRSIGGYELNGSGLVSPRSGSWRSTDTINRIDITPQDGNYAQYSHFALYGIK